MIKRLFKRKRAKSVIYWDNCDIPARLFFNIINDGDYSVLGNAPDEELEAAFDKIFDEYVDIDENEKVTDWYKKRAKVAMIEAKITIITVFLHHIVYSPLTKEERIEFINEINSVDGVRVNFSLDKPILDEVQRVQNVVLGSLKNQLNAELGTDKKQQEAVKNEYEKRVVNIENVLERSIDYNCSLRLFIQYEKSAIERSNEIKKLRSKNGNK